MTGIVAMGESMALMSTGSTGLLRHATSLRLGMAGAESNVLIGAVRLGASTRWIGRVGDDEFGELIAMTIRGQGVAASVIVDPDAPTGLMFKERRSAQMTRVRYYRSGSAGSRLSPVDVDTGAIASARVLHLTGITPALSDSARAAVFGAMDEAAAAGTIISFDLNFRAALWGESEAAPVLRDLISRADVVFATEDEARIVCEGDTAEILAARIAALGPAQVVIKRGSAGAVALLEGQPFEAPPEPVLEVDPVGAGDAFTAGYLTELCLDADPTTRLRTAALAGAFAVTVDGDWEGAPNRADLATIAASAGRVMR